MRIDKISVHNFLSHKHTELDITSMNPVIVVGENGAGKSSLVKDAVTWCLFGRARANGDELITEGEKSCEVEVEFSLGQNAYRVRRVREREKKTTLNLDVSYIDGKGHPDNGATIAETQQKIENLLGMTYDLFIMSACVEQGKSDSFSVLAPKEAKHIIMKILRLDEYDKYLEEVRLRLKNKEKESFATDLSLSAVQMQLADAVEESSLEEQRDKLREQITLEKTLSDERSSIDMPLAEEKAKLASNVVERSKLSMYGVQLDDAMSKVAARVETLAKMNGECPLCLSKLDEQRKVDLIKTLKTRLSRYAEERSGVSSKILQMLERTTHQQQTINAFELRIRAIFEQAEIIDASIRALESALGFLQAKETEKLKLEQRVRELEAALILIDDDHAVLSALEGAFDKNGIPTRIIESVIPEIELESNKLLEVLSDRKLRLEISTQKTLKSGGIGETLDIAVLSDLNRRLYDSLSGGEKFRIDLAIRIALSSVLARRNNFKISTLIIDEGFGSLDELGKIKFVELSQQLRPQFERVIVVTHTDIRDMYAAENVIVVKKIDGESRVLKE
jgi:DNA repair exonuclease SbcCD ATPase subunit